MRPPPHHNHTSTTSNTSPNLTVSRYFNDLGKHQLDFVWGKNHPTLCEELFPCANMCAVVCVRAVEGGSDGELIDMAFSKKRAEDRKSWLGNYDSEVSAGVVWWGEGV